MKQLFFGVLIFLLSIPPLHSQDYNTSLGLRLSPYYGVTLKHFINTTRALEGILATRKDGVSFTGLYEVHTPAFSTQRLQAFGGIGGHFNIFGGKDRGIWFWDDDDDNGIRLKNDRHLTIGIDMILGLEYTFDQLPFNLGIDWKPALNLFGDHGYSVDQLALSFRFIF